MKLKSSKLAEEQHQKNMDTIKKLIAKFSDPDTPPEEREKIKQRFQAIIDFSEKKEPTDSMFLRLVNKINLNGNGKH